MYISETVLQHALSRPHNTAWPSIDEAEENAIALDYMNILDINNW